MATQVLIYETAVPVSSGRHGKCAVEMGENYGFARSVNAVPLMAVEFPLAAAEYAVVFSQSGEEVVPVVILGAQLQQNLYVNAADKWQANYIPAFIRRYPFVFTSSADGETFTLCVDEAFQGLNYLGRGKALFDAEGKPTAYVDDVLKFLQEYRAQYLRTKAFCSQLKALDLLEPMQAEFTLVDGEKMSLTGFQVVSRTRLKALSADTLHALAQSDALELVYAHLYSMRNFTALKDKLVQRRVVAPTAATQAAAQAAAASARASEFSEAGGAHDAWLQ